MVIMLARGCVTSTPQITDQGIESLMHHKFMTVGDIFSSQIDLELSLSFYWRDARLNVTGHCQGFLEDASIKSIWTPRPYIPHMSHTSETVGRLVGSTEFFQAIFFLEFGHPLTFSKVKRTYAFRQTQISSCGN